MVGQVVVADDGVAVGSDGDRSVGTDLAGAVDCSDCGGCASGTITGGDLEIAVGVVVVADDGVAIGSDGDRCLPTDISGAVDRVGCRCNDRVIEVGVVGFARESGVDLCFGVVPVVVIVIDVVAGDVHDQVGGAVNVKTDRTVGRRGDVQSVGDVDTVLEIQRRSVRRTVATRGARIRGDESVVSVLAGARGGDVDGHGGGVSGHDLVARTVDDRDDTFHHESPSVVDDLAAVAGVQNAHRVHRHVDGSIARGNDRVHHAESAGPESHCTRRAKRRPPGSPPIG